ncbi:hypothetical protein QVD17_16234 [Tagetes erecta]|uniref:Protein kinase domain-containing protein n=1 Tax=Tagetes erecta TaxID=13708 RepID=A0AAD8P0C3_TARER|nr:hypothetical protein QVD17_16234 [Tagetes erecta]
MEEFDHLKIPLKDVILATDNFGPRNLVGRGGFGSVYKGELSRPEGCIMVAFGTPGYCDPLYMETGILSKESDVYSFGVVLFEVMCGTLCCEYRDGRLLGILVPMWKKCFEEKRLDEIITHGLENMEPGSFITFSTIAYRCLRPSRKERPTMVKIVQKLKIALEQQEVFEDLKKRMNFEGMRRIADQAVFPLSYVTQSQLLLLFMKGVLIDNGKTWFSVNKKGQHCELISAPTCISTSDNTLFIAPNANLVSRFEHLLKYISPQELRLKVKTQFLSPNVTYIINLVYECGCYHHCDWRIPFKYKLEEMSQYSMSCVARVGKDGWLRTELFQFTSTKNEHHFDIQFSSEIMFGEDGSISIEGIEFCPVDFEKDEKKVDMQPAYAKWAERLPNDYAKIIKDIDQESMTRKEIYFLLRKGVYINNSQQWFSISKKSKKRIMLPARAILPKENLGWSFLSRRKSWHWKSLPGSRFKEAAECCDKNHFTINARIESQVLSPDIWLFREFEWMEF